MKYTIHIGNKPIVFEHESWKGTINVDDLTKIDTSNIYGEATTISAACNHVGLMRAELEKNIAEAKLDLKVFEGKFKEELRRQAANDSGYFTIRVKNEDTRIKATEKALETAHETDDEWIAIKKKFIKAEADFNALSALYWSMQDKARKLNNLMSGTTPEEFVSSLVEGKINGILIKKK